MLNKIFQQMIFPLFSIKSSNKMAIASSIGLMIGLIPLDGMQIPAILAISLIFRLNIIALLLGLSLNIMLPLLYVFLIWSTERLADSNIMVYSIWDMSFRSLHQSFSGNKQQFTLFVVLTLLLSSISFYIFHLFYHSAYAIFFSKEPKMKVSLSSSIGIFLGSLPLSPLQPLSLIILPVIFRLNAITLAFGMMIGTLIISPDLQMLSIFENINLNNHEIILILAGQVSTSDLILWINNGQKQLLIAFLACISLPIILLPLFKSFYSCEEASGYHYIKNYIFHDGSGIRWAKLKRLGRTFAAIALTAVILFGSCIITGASFPSFKSDTGKTGYPPAASTVLLNQNTQRSLVHLNNPDNSTLSRKQNQLTFGFYVSWDENSKISLNKNIHSIDVLIPDWFHLSSDLTVNFKPQISIDTLAKQNNIKILPLINNFVNNQWDKNVVQRLLDSEKEQNKFINTLLTYTQKHGYQGINIDFEYIDPHYRNLYTAFISRLYALFHANGLVLSIDIPPFNKAYDYSKLSEVSDYMVLMLYDEHSLYDQPGPIVSEHWYTNALKECSIPDNKLVIGVGNYGYDWIKGSKKPASSLTYEGIINLANRTKATHHWDKQSRNSYLSYQKDNQQHILWFTDALSIYNQIAIAQREGFSGVALWRLGSEDHSVWNVFNKNTKDMKTIHHVSTQLDMDNVGTYGEGEILTGLNYMTGGSRTFDFDSSGLITNINYQSFPKNIEIVRNGKSSGKKVALTFDDGPNPLYTPKIIEILDRYHVKGTFFVVGNNAKSYPEIVKTIFNKGHEIGNHTLTHPDIEKITDIQLKNELESTKSIIQKITGHSTLLFRQPYNVNFDSPDNATINTFITSQSLGYVMVGSSIDPKDWQSKSAGEVVDKMQKSLKKGNIVLLHDDGGNRSITIEALPRIIETLKKQGYEFVTVGSLMNKSSTEVMPPLNINNSAFLVTAESALALVRMSETLITYLFLFATSVGFIRFILLIYFATKQKKKYRNLKFNETFKPLVSVVVAAYNEEKVISQTVASILESDYSNMEILVVNDGSSDATAEVVSKAFAGNPRVRLINKENGGKSSAVNRGFKEAYGNIVVVLDADTLLSRDAVSLLVRHFQDPNVAAVSGNVKVGNQNKLLTVWQHIEYVTGLNLERRAFDLLNCITVVPGAIGAWRKDLVAFAGYYQEDTLAEDADITLSFLEKGYKIVYEEGARAFTEAPEDMKSFLKQRLRWSYGTLQCLWKHKNSLFSSNQKMLGFIALPNMWLYQFLFQLFSPLTDILFVLGLVSGNVYQSIALYMTFFLVDFITTVYAFRLEKESIKPLVWMLLQRIVYRQLMTYVVYKSIISALKGVKIGWNKLNRVGNVVMSLKN